MLTVQIRRKIGGCLQCLNISLRAGRVSQAYILIYSYAIGIMAKYKFKCSDIGMNCSFSAAEKNREDLVKKIADHAKSAHQINEISPELKTKVDSAIKKSLF
jgi:predicted small metal-binding protein